MKPKRRPQKQPSAKKLNKVLAKLPALHPDDWELLDGVYSATVTDTRDPMGLGQVEVVVASISERPMWARVATLMAGNECGTWFVPSVGDEVLVAFGASNPKLPTVIGALWNAANRPPESMDKAGQNYKRSIRTNGGLKLTFNDKDASLMLETRGGHKVVLSDSSESISITDANGNKIRRRAALRSARLPN